jgi:two-component system, NtrC family, nitrogen regulation sensor histidine kinase NtrY
MASANNITSSFTTASNAGFSVRQKDKANRNYRKRLRPKIAIRLVGICILGCLTGYLVFDSPYWLAGIWTALATVALFYETVRFVDQSERKLVSFLQSLNQNDFSVTFHESAKSQDYDLHRAFNELNDTFKTLRSDKEAQHQLLQVIVETATVPMMCFKETDGRINIINDAAKRLFGVPFITDIKVLRRIEPSFLNLVQEIRDGEKESLKLTIDGKQTFLSVTSRHIVFKGTQLKLIAFHDVSSELAARESETWQKLLRVLTHEISNSAIPLSTLSSYIYELLYKQQHDLSGLSEEDRTDILISLRTIEQRSKSLKDFVINFRSVNQVPEPKMKKIDIQEFFKEITPLFRKELEKENIILTIRELTEPVIVYADKDLTMQVLINLVKNAIEAMSNLKEHKEISVICEKQGRYAHLHVADTGTGIEPDNLEQIFIPFFSTKRTGSGIGLSISQQIMQKQKGDITVRSTFGKGSAFTLTFNA